MKIKYFIQNSTNRYWSFGLLLFIFIWGILYATFANEPLQLLSQSWPYFFIGFCGAFLGNISAVGGGIVFIPTMMFFYHHPAVLALKIAILSQCFGMTSGAIGWLKKVKIPKKILLLTIPSLIFGSTLSTLVFHPSALIIKVLFGPVSIFIGFMTLYSIRKNKNKHERNTYDLSLKGNIFLAFSAFIGGLITGWIAIGEGEVVSSFLMIFYQVNSVMSIALGVLLLAINSFYLAIIHQIFYNGLPWEICIFTGFGCILGARLAPRIGTIIKPNYLKLIFALIAITDGLLFIFQFIISKK